MQLRKPRFTPDKLDSALERICSALDLDHHGARLLRFTNNAVYALAQAPVVVRIVGSRALAHRAFKVVAVARHLQLHGVPATRLYPGVRQPIVLGGQVATAWWRVPETKSRPTPADLAALLRQVHALPPPGSVGDWAPLDDVRARIADAEELDPADRRFLADRCARTQAALDALEFPSPPALLHGDAHLGNVLAGPDGPLLCDFDSACVGPPEWDLVPVAVGVRRFGEPVAVYRELAEAYGFDVMAWRGYPTLQAARELKLTTSVLPILRSHPEVRPELRRRLADLRAGRCDTRWTRYR
jgi:aminoglycoside phosphotransferase (APT) family kinase protein